MSPRRTIALMLLLLEAVGCYSWKPSKLTPEQTVEGRSKVLVLGQTLRDPWVRNDSLGGTAADTIWAVPLSSVTTVQTKQLDKLQSAVMVLSALGWATIIVGLAVLPDTPCPNLTPDGTCKRYGYGSGGGGFFW